MISHGQPSAITKAHSRKNTKEALAAGLAYARFYQGIAKGDSQKQAETDIYIIQKAIKNHEEESK